MNNIFLIDRNIITYDDLIRFINGNYLGFDLSEHEKYILELIKRLADPIVNDFHNLITSIKYRNCDIILNTSGTTGSPKEIIHGVESITRNILVSDKYVSSNWGLTYQIGKMAFYQVLFQSLFNKSCLINLSGYDFNSIKDRIIKNNVTHISATPTFYRMLLSDEHIYGEIKQVTVGGESLNDSLLNTLKIKFPNSSIKNIYASTEAASLFASEDCNFKIPDKYRKKIKILDSTLRIHKDLLGTINEEKLVDDWYDTKDEVEKINDSEFRFVGRKNVEINVSGVKINPIKVESVINSLDYIKNCIVYSKKNSVIGNILCCDIIIKKNMSKAQIKEDLRKLLDKYEIPSVINLVESIAMNSNSKISRK